MPSLINNYINTKRKTAFLFLPFICFLQYQITFAQPVSDKLKPIYGLCEDWKSHDIHSIPKKHFPLQLRLEQLQIEDSLFVVSSIANFANKVKDFNERQKIMYLSFSVARLYSLHSEVVKILDKCISDAYLNNSNEQIVHGLLTKAKYYMYSLRVNDAYPLLLLEKALTLCKDDLMKFRIRNEIASYHYGNGDENLAIKLFNELIPDTLKYKNTIRPSVFINALNAIGLIYRRNQDYDSALFFMNKALEMIETLEITPRNSRQWETILTGNIAGIYFLKGDYDKAEPLITYTLLRNSSYESQVKSYLELSAIYLNTNRVVKAKAMLDEAETIALENKVYKKLPDIYEGYSKFWEANNNLEKALISYQKSKFLADSINQNRIELDKEIALFTNDTFLSQEELPLLNQREDNIFSRYKNQVYILVIFFIAVFLITIVILIRGYKISKRLGLQEIKLMTQQKELSSLKETVNEEVKALAFKTSIIQKKLEELTFMNSHLIRGPLVRVIGILNLWEMGWLNKEEQDEMHVIIKNHLKDLDEITSTSSIKLGECQSLMDSDD